MAIAGANLTSNFSDTDATSYTTASVTPTTNNLVLVAITWAKVGTADAVSLSGNSLTYVQIGSTLTYDAAGTQRHLAVFRALGASPTAGQITISFGDNTQLSCCWTVDQFSGVDTSGTNGSGAIVQAVPNSAATTQTTVVATLADFGSTNNAAYGACAESGSQAITVGSGFSQLAQEEATNSAIVLASEWRNDNDTTVDFTVPSSGQELGIIGIEIKAAVTTAVKDIIGGGIIPFARS